MPDDDVSVVQRLQEFACSVNSGTFNLAAGETAKIVVRVDFDQRHPGAARPAHGNWGSLARLQGLPPERGLEKVGGITHGHMWAETDHFFYLEDAAGVEKAHDYSGDMMIVGSPLGRAQWP